MSTDPFNNVVGQFSWNNIIIGGGRLQGYSWESGVHQMYLLSIIMF